MGKPRIIIADTDISYVIPIQLKFITEFFEKIDLEIITDQSYYDKLFSGPQNADVLIVSEELYDLSLQRHNINHIFLMKEEYEDSQTSDLKVTYLAKYASIKEIFNTILGKSADVFSKIKTSEDAETKVLLFYSEAGGAGKTTLAMGVSACLAKSYKKVLYINASSLQVFQHLISNRAPISAPDVYAQFTARSPLEYDKFKHVIRKELFCYIPPFKAALMSLDIDYTIYGRIIGAVKKSGEYDYIVVDTDSGFDDGKVSLFNIADKTVVVIQQNLASIVATNLLFANINGVNSEKYLVICNNFDKERDNALIASNVSLKFSVDDYVEHFDHYDQMCANDLAAEKSMQRISFVII